MLSYYIEKNLTEVTVNDFKVIRCNYGNNVWKWKDEEALLIKKSWPIFNVQEQSVALRLLNWYPT